MHGQSRARLIVAAGILFTAALWIASSVWPGAAVAQEPAKKAKAAERRPLSLDRAPVRVIWDQNPVMAGIAIDPQRDEVFITNDNESGGVSVAVYPAQFPPTDKVMEPRRRIAGPKAHLGLPCGVAISPEFNEMYTASGDGQDVNIFPLMANGDAPPARLLEVPHASGGIYLDAKNDELYITTEHVNKLSIYRRTAQGQDDPVRFIQGPSTELADPHGIYVDDDKNEILVTNHGNWRKTEPGEGYAQWGDGKLARVRGSQSHPGIVEPLAPSTGKFMPSSITVYPRTAQGDVAPLRTIQGSRTQMNVPLGIARDPMSGQIVVANSGGDSVLFFDGNANGDVAPVRVLKGSSANLKGPTGVLIDAKRNELWVTNWDNHKTSVFSRTADGNVAPLRVIRNAPDGTPFATLGRPAGAAYDSKRKEILTPN